MRKYLEVGIITLKAQIAYRFDFFLKILISFCRVLLPFIMWRAIFKNHSQIAGFTFSTMVTYYIINAFFKRLDVSTDIVWQISGEVRDGQFTKYLVKPIKPMGYFISSSVSKTVFTLGISLVTTSACAVLFSKYFVLPKGPENLVMAFLISMLGISFLILMNYFIGILSFKFIDVGGLNMIKDNFVEFLTGALIPLALLPQWLQEIMRFTPFYYINYYPSMIYLNREMDRIGKAVATLLLWNTIMAFINIITYRKLRKSYEGVGI